MPSHVQSEAKPVTPVQERRESRCAVADAPTLRKSSAAVTTRALSTIWGSGFSTSATSHCHGVFFPSAIQFVGVREMTQDLVVSRRFQEFYHPAKNRIQYPGNVPHIEVE